MHQVYRPGRTLRHTGTTSLAFNYVYLRLAAHIHPRHLIGTYADTGQASGAARSLHNGNYAATRRFSLERMVQALATAA